MPGALFSLNSKPIRRPPRTTRRSSSAPWWVPQKKHSLSSAPRWRVHCSNYQAEGVKFPCSSCNDIIACDTAAANLCVQSNQSGGSGYDDSEDSSGCVLSGGDSRGSSGASLLALGGALALSFARRRRARRGSSH